MKSKKWIILGITLACAMPTMAQETDVIRKRPAGRHPEDMLTERNLSDLDAALSEQKKQLAANADRFAERMLAQAGGGGMSADFAPDVTGFARQRATRTLIIPKDASDTKSLGEVEEDLGVMAHILDKTVSSGDKSPRAMGITVYGKIPGPASAPQNLYVEGHGAIFLLNVNYSLLPPPNKEAETETKEPVNNEWEEARREMAHPNKNWTDAVELFEQSFGPDSSWNVKLPAPEYDAEKVEQLKKDLISALKNAANIRRLKSDETVTVVVSAPDTGVVTKTFKSSTGKPGSAQKSERMVIAKNSSGDRAGSSGAAKLILKARKGDADAFQNGKLTFEEFRKKVTTMLY